MRKRKTNEPREDLLSFVANAESEILKGESNDNDPLLAQANLLSESLKRCRGEMKSVLWVVGAGASVEAGVMSFSQIGEKVIEGLEEKEIKDSSLLCVKSLAEELKDGVITETSAARLFSLLIGDDSSRDEENGNQNRKILDTIWDSISRKIIKSVLVGNKDGIYKEISRLSLNSDIPCHCFTTNFDALMERSSENSISIFSPDSLQEWFLSPKIGADKKAIIEFRGDAFLAVCKTQGCPYRQPTQITDFILGKNVYADRQIEDKLKCACGSTRKLAVSFPGRTEKELEILRQIYEFDRFAGMGVGCIVSVGYSGSWDIPLTDYLIALASRLGDQRMNNAQQNACSVFVIDPAESFLLQRLKANRIQAQHVKVKIKDEKGNNYPGTCEFLKKVTV